MASVIELSKALAQVPKTGREGVGISKENWEGGGGELGEIQPGHGI